MIRLIVLVAVCAFAVWAGLNLHDKNSILIIVYKKKSYELALWVGVLFSLIGFAFLYYACRLIGGFLNLPDKMSTYSVKRRKKRAEERTNLGLIQLAEGHWAKAERYLIQGATHAQMPLFNYLSAAKAAQEQGDDKRRDAYLMKAHEATEGMDIAVGLTQAQLQLSHGQYEQSLATLKHLRQLAPNHPYVLKLLKKLYLNLRDWENLLKLLPVLFKNNLIDSSEHEILQRQIYRELLIEANADNSALVIKTLWQKVPRSLHLDNELVFIYANALNDHQEAVEAEAVLRLTLKKQWSEPLIRLYGLILTPNIPKQLAWAEGLLKTHQDSAGLLLTLGRLSIHSQLWGKAERYLESSLNLEHNPEVYAELGGLYEQMQKPNLSFDCFKKGLMLATPHSNTTHEGSGLSLIVPLMNHKKIED